ncbi:MAG TPA: SGNH/GDSL hydrolase family protein [Deltaproteobacteria bacterium]|nr:SGNH/GDSL hydrolase family protein [Deltaproteobacteria bacterium]
MRSLDHFRTKLKLFFISMLMAVAIAGCSNGGNALYYVALGDSLSVGVQQDPATGEDVPTDEGYADVIYAALLPTFPELQLVKLGCPGETTVSMVNGGVCDNYSTGNQLGDAVDFLLDHQDEILLVTLDIGANDVLQSDCLTLPAEEQQACFTALFQSVGSNLGLINSTLFAAADGEYPVVGMNYYNTFLNAWLLGPMGQAIAMVTAVLQQQFNTLVLGEAYGEFGFPVADVAATFQSNNFTTLVPFPLPPPNDMVPINVALICQWTYLCPSPLTGLTPDIHPNATGYQMIGNTFLAVINPLLGL